MFYCTKLEWTARQILTAYSYRWAIECTFQYCKQLLGLEDPANRLPKAVERTAPMALVLYSLIVVWFHKTGHSSVRFPNRPWYPRKQEPSFADLLTTLRRVSLEEKSRTLLPTLPAQVRAGGGLAVHFSTPLPGGAWLIELRQIKDKISRRTGTGTPGRSSTCPRGRR